MFPNKGGRQMPPSYKFTRQEMIEAGLKIVREQGLAALTARSLAQALEASPKVIFGHFNNMEDFSHQVIEAGKQVFVDRVTVALQGPYAFRNVGLEYIRFASQEPKLFQILFLDEREPVTHFSQFLPLKDYSYEGMLAAIEGEYDLEPDQAATIYQHLFIYSHGIASMIATGIYRFSPQEIEERMIQLFTSLIMTIKKGA